MLNISKISLVFLTLGLLGNDFITAQTIPVDSSAVIVTPQPAPVDSSAVIVTPQPTPASSTVIVTPQPATVDPSTVIVTPLPAPKEVMVEPAGYIECNETAPQWYNGVWYAGYKTCRYNTDNPSYKGTAWVAGHWSCSQYNITNSQAVCSYWDWVTGGWVGKQ